MSGGVCIISGCVVAMVMVVVATVLCCENIFYTLMQSKAHRLGRGVEGRERERGKERGREGERRGWGGRGEEAERGRQRERGVGGREEGRERRQ